MALTGGGGHPLQPMERLARVRTQRGSKGRRVRSSGRAAGRLAVLGEQSLPFVQLRWLAEGGIARGDVARDVARLGALACEGGRRGLQERA